MNHIWATKRLRLVAIAGWTIGLAVANASTLFEQADAAFKAEKYDLAIAKYSAALKENPKSFSVYNNRALAYAAAKDYEHAIADFTAALRLKRDWLVFYNRGVSYQEKKDLNAAINDFTNAIRLSPPNTIARSDSLIARAHCYFNQEKAAPAMADLNAAIKIGVKEADAFILRGILHKVNHSYERSLADQDKAIALEPNSARAYDVAAYLLAVCPAPKYRDGRKAITYATKACDLTAWKDARCLETLAAAYAEAGQFEEAVRWQSKAAEMDSAAVDSKRIAFYRDRQPFRDLNRKEEPVPNLSKIQEKISIRTGQKLNLQLELNEQGALRPVLTPAQPTAANSLALDFHEEKVGKVLYLSHKCRTTLTARCLARLKGYDTYFETDILPIPVNRVNREIWSDPIDELVLFDFKLKTGEEPERPQMSRNGWLPGQRYCTTILF